MMEYWNTGMVQKPRARTPLHHSIIPFIPSMAPDEDGAETPALQTPSPLLLSPYTFFVGVPAGEKSRAAPRRSRSAGVLTAVSSSQATCAPPAT